MLILTFARSRRQFWKVHSVLNLGCLSEGVDIPFYYDALPLGAMI